jgi:integrase/recombinase XerD
MLALLLPFAAGELKKSVDRLLVTDISGPLVRTFLANLEEVRHCVVRTRNQRLGALHALARFIGERSPEHVEWCGQIRTIPVKRGQHVPVTYLEKDEMDALLASPDRNKEQGRRDFAILLFLYNSGARASEAAQAIVGDLNWDCEGGGSVRLRGKGNKTRVCPLWTKTIDVLHQVVQDRPAGAPVFRNRYGNPITRFGIHTLVARHVAVAAQKVASLREKHVGPHTIRHTTATHLLRAGVDINTIRAWLGHVSVDTTNIYAETDLSTKAKALAACAPGSELGKIPRWRHDPDLMDFLRNL